MLFHSVYGKEGATQEITDIYDTDENDAMHHLNEIKGDLDNFFSRDGKFIDSPSGIREEATYVKMSKSELLDDDQVCSSQTIDR